MTAKQRANAQPVQSEAPVQSEEPVESVKLPIGRAKSGQFEVPQTWDMIHTILDPRLKKTPADIATFFILFLYCFLYFYIPPNLRTTAYFLAFAFWRAAYNVGIGYLLQKQSNESFLVHLATKSKVFTKESPYHKYFLADLKARLSVNDDSKVEALPLEFKTWITFRHLVDLILMSDFVTYCLLAISVFHHTDHSYLIVLGRWVAGLILVLFNLWVKIDAHRVVKDYAWYWGDFFFLQDSDLTFDGVFELAPHPMYSIGYAAYYGMSLITASTTLFVASILAHTAQFYFLIAVENPHIDKTYGNNTVPPQAMAKAEALEEAFEDANCTESFNFDNSAASKPLLGFSNFNFTRTTDVMLLALVMTTSAIGILPYSRAATSIGFLIALTWRLLHSVGLGVLLRRQSDSKYWTKLFLKYGFSPVHAYRQWQAIYNTTNVMSYVSFLVFAFGQLRSPFEASYWPFRLALGGMLIGLHCWTSFSIYESLDEYGWFYGDFFYLKKSHALTYSGIYRYLNHPERLAGIAGVWGVALICCSSVMTVMAFIWTFLNLGFIQFVEKPHMRKLYGVQNVERDSGVAKNLRKPAQHFNFDRYIRQYTQYFQQFEKELIKKMELVELLKPKVEGVVYDTKKILKQNPARLTIITRHEKLPSTAGYRLEPLKSCFQYGEPIEAKFTAPEPSDNDWIAVYRLGENTSDKISTVSSAGRWMYYSSTANNLAVFKGDQLFWEEGTYELRYHYKNKHNVLARSAPFEVKVTKRAVTVNLESELEALNALFASHVSDAHSKVICCNNESLARFSDGLERIYGIGLAPFVIQKDRTVKKVAERMRKYEALIATIP